MKKVFIKLFRILPITLIIIFCILILSLSIRGVYGNPTSESINQPYWKEDGPLELSPERGRFALMFSLVEDSSFHFSLPIARFATPDLGYKDGNYVSLFAPGVSFIIIPGYLLGKSLHIGQVGAISVISFFALLNIILLRLIAIRLGSNPIAATIGSLVFIFASPAFSYAATLYQHHISTFLILASIYLLFRWRNFWSLALIWFLSAVSIVVDYPNLFMMFPIGLFALGSIIIIQGKKKGFKINIKLIRFLTLLAVVIPLSFFLWFNKMSYGNPLQLSGTVPSVKAIDSEGKPTAADFSSQERIEQQINPEKQQKSAISAFDPRNLLEGLHIHFISPDRGIVLYTPVILFGIIGAFVLYNWNQQALALLLSISGVNILLYSMWGDPWGGWAFGSRYLIPTYAISSIFIAVLLTKWKRKIIFLVVFFLISIYSIAVNTLGAITTSAIPPQVEILSLEKISGIVQKYTYERNWDFLLAGNSKSFAYQTYFSNYFSPLQYYLILTTSIGLILGGLLVYFYFISRKGGRNA